MANESDPGGCRALCHANDDHGNVKARSGLNATFASVMPKDGRVAFVSQSGAICSSVLDWAQEEEIGFSCFVSVGNMIDVDFGDLIDYLAADSQTEALVLYVESITEARKFMSAARAFTRTKPIVAYKAGRFPESAKAAASHTGALAGEGAVYEAAFERAGIVRVNITNAKACNTARIGVVGVFQPPVTG